MSNQETPATNEQPESVPVEAIVHSPPPWSYIRAREDCYGADHYVLDRDGDEVARTYATDTARLITAAPRMLEALQHTLAYLQLRADGDSNVLWARVGAVLTELTGQNVE